MRDLKISLCHHPTTVVFVDDNQDYLDQLEIGFNDLLPLYTFNNPVAALEFLNKDCHEETFIRRCTKIPEIGEGTYDHFVSDVNLKLIQNEVLRPERFKEVAVVVVDYSMPGMNGIEFCKQIKNSNILIILLTGEADYELAIREFNNNTIDVFIKKTATNIKEVLYNEIIKLQQQYFINLSNIIINQANPNNLKCLESEEVSKHFYKLCKELDIIEYYILTEAGDFLLVNKQGYVSYLTIKSDEEIRHLYEHAEISGVTNELLNALAHRDKIPLLYDDPDPKDWEKHLSLAHPVSDKKEYYYAYTNNIDDYLNKILPYNNYLASV